MSFIDKYKPASIADTVFNDAATQKRVEQYAKGQRTGNIIFHGPKGTAKSTTARIIGKELCNKVGSENSAPIFQAANLNQENLENIWGEWSFQRMEGVKNPVAIIEEVDQLNPKLQQKLRAMMDEASIGKLIFTTNNIHAVDGPLVDRCDDIEMPVANTDAWLDRARTILDAEGVPYTDAQLKALLKTCNGSIRDLMRALEDFVLERK